MLTSRSACTAPNAFDTPSSDNTMGRSGPGVDTSLLGISFFLVPPYGYIRCSSFSGTSEVAEASCG
jgi:hypothetical protein